MTNLFDLHGRHAIVTGGSKGIGRAIAVALASAGADIALVDVLPMDESKALIEAHGVRCITIECDVTDFAKARETIVSDTLAAFGSIEVLVNVAGYNLREDAIDYPEEWWDRIMDVQLKQVFVLCQSVARHMIERGYGKIINIASLNAFNASVRIPAYVAAKGGVAQLTKAFSNEWVPLGVRVNAIAPGWVKTDMTQAVWTDETMSRSILDRIPIGRWATPDDIAGTAVYLAAPASDYVSGTVVCVDGGFLAR